MYCSQLDSFKNYQGFFKVYKGKYFTLLKTCFASETIKLKTKSWFNWSKGNSIKWKHKHILQLICPSFKAKTNRQSVADKQTVGGRYHGLDNKNAPEIIQIRIQRLKNNWILFRLKRRRLY